jgi:hypothetical protein
MPYLDCNLQQPPNNHQWLPDELIKGLVSMWANEEGATEEAKAIWHRQLSSLTFTGDLAVTVSGWEAELNQWESRQRAAA